MKIFLPLLLVPWLLLAQTAPENTTAPGDLDPVPAGVLETQPEGGPEAQPVFSSIEEELASLSALNDSISWREQERDKLYEQMQAAVDPLQRERLLPELNKINEELASLRRRFQSMAVKTDISVFEEEPKKEFNWQDELGQLLEPLLKEMKAATRESRELGEITDRLEANQLRLRTAREALKNLEPLLEAGADPELRDRFEKLEAAWTDRMRDAENQITVDEHQLNLRQKDRENLLEKTKGMASGFVRTRGLNLLLGALAFGGVFLIMRGLHKSWSKFRPGRKKGRSFSSRLTSLIWTVLTLIIAVGAMVGTFNATGDWFLLSLTLLFLLGVAWAGMKALPGMIELFRMMLNMGAVREDERLVYEGLPWKVNAISFRTELVNPLLNGGVLTLPTHMLVGLLSRPQGEDEEWFPSQKGDWVLLADGTFGKVSYQTPSAVQIVSPGGSQRVYTTPQYVELSPTVLSTGFRREVVFGIDYSHLAEAVADLTEIMKAYLRELLEGRLGDNLQHLDVRLAEAAESSINVSVIVDCKGEAAPNWFFIPMWVQEGLMKLCHERGWQIPFPQLRIHQDP